MKDKELFDRWIEAIGLGFCLVVLCVALFWSLAQGKLDVLLLLIGFFTGFATRIATFRWGSSSGSKEKDKLIQAKPEEKPTA